MICKNCQKEIPDGESCPFCGAPAGPEAQDAKVSPDDAVIPPNRKKRPLVRIILAAVAVLVVVAIVVGLMTNWYGLYGPGTKILRAASNTFSSGSFTANLSMELQYESGFFGSYTQDTEGSVKVQFDIQERELMLYGELGTGGENIVVAVYDGYCIFGYAQQYQAVDISQSLDQFFDSCQSGQQQDWEDVLKSMDEDLYEELGDSIDFARVNKCLFSYMTKLNNDRWLEENAGYSTEKDGGVTLYQFSPDNYKFLRATLGCFEDAFREDADYAELLDELKSNKQDYNAYDIHMEMSVEDQKLVSLDLEVGCQSVSVDLEMDFTDIGNTKIDRDLLSQLLDSAAIYQY